MSELAQALIADSYAAPPAHILEAVPEELVHAAVLNAPHTLYQELWHLAFWQQITLDWIAGVETPFPARPEDAFPSSAQTKAEPWEPLRRRFLSAAEQAASIARNKEGLGRAVFCPSRPGETARVMTVGDQLISSAAHNAYHLGRIVLLRQLLSAWPPPSGGFTW